MQVQDENAKGRFVRFFTSTFVLGMFGTAIGAGASLDNTPVFLPVGLYVGYLTLSGLLLSLIAGRLFKQHEVRKFKIDLAGSLLLTTLFALPLGASNGFVWIIRNFGTEDNANSAPELVVPIAGFLFFLMLPTFMAIEATMAWWLKWRHRS